MKTILIIAAIFLLQTSCALNSSNHCGKIIGIEENSYERKEIINSINLHINKYYKEVVAVDKVYLVNKRDIWYIAAVGFDKLDSSIFAIKRTESGYSIVEDLGGNFSGTGNKADFISNYFLTNVPSVSRELIDCSAKQLEEIW